MASRPYKRKNRMRKSALAIAVLAFALTGCLEDATKPETNPAKGITFSGFPGSLSATPSSSAKVTGTIDAGKALDSVVVGLTDAGGASVSRNNFPTSGKT